MSVGVDVLEKQNASARVGECTLRRSTHGVQRRLMLAINDKLNGWRGDGVLRVEGEFEDE